MLVTLRNRETKEKNVTALQNNKHLFFTNAIIKSRRSRSNHDGHLGLFFNLIRNIREKNKIYF